MPHPVKKAAIVGWPAKHSLSPRLHGFWLHACGIDGGYEAMPTPPENLADLLRDLHIKGFCGVNLTIPHKQAACAIMDSLDETARDIGAVNLVVVGADGSLQGRNTDAYGFTQNLLLSGYVPKNGAALVLGAGGAARAIIYALMKMGLSEIRIANRTIAHAEKLAQDFATPQCRITPVAWQDAEKAQMGIELLVNTTSLGMKGQPELLLSLDALPPTATVNDIIYAPLETPLLAQARARGFAAIDGLGMLLHQARPSFQAFFGHDPEVTQALRDYVLGNTQ